MSQDVPIPSLPDAFGNAPDALSDLVRENAELKAEVSRLRAASAGEGVVRSDQSELVDRFLDYFITDTKSDVARFVNPESVREIAGYFLQFQGGLHPPDPQVRALTDGLTEMSAIADAAHQENARLKDDPVCEHGTALDVHCCGDGGQPYPGCHSGFIFDSDSCRCVLSEPEPAYWRCYTCSCLWRDNHDGTVSLAGPRQIACAQCEGSTPENCEPLYLSAPAVPQEPGITERDFAEELQKAATGWIETVVDGTRQRRVTILSADFIRLVDALRARSSPSGDRP